MMGKATPKSSFGASKPAAWDLRLHVAGNNRRSTLILEMLKNVGEEPLSCQYPIEVVDLREHAQLARTEQIVAILLLSARTQNRLGQELGT